MIAAHVGSQTMATFLMSCKAEIDLVDNVGDSAIMKAANNQQLSLVTYLFDLGARVDLTNKHHKTVLDYPESRNLLLSRCFEKIYESLQQSSNCEEKFQKYFSKHLNLNQVHPQVQSLSVSLSPSPSDPSLSSTFIPDRLDLHCYICCANLSDRCCQ